MLPTQGFGAGGAIVTYGYGGGGAGVVDFFETMERDIALNDEVDRSMASGIVRTEFKSDQKNLYSSWPDTFTIKRNGNGGNIIQNFIARRNGYISKVRIPMYRTTVVDFKIQVIAVDPLTHLVKFPRDMPGDFYFLHQGLNADLQMGPPAAWAEFLADIYFEMLPVVAGVEYGLWLQSATLSNRQYLGYDATNQAYTPGKAYEIDRLGWPQYQVEKAWDIPFEIFVDETVHLTEKDIAFNDQVSRSLEL